MAKQSARRDRKNQGFPPCFISTLRVMWFRSANSHTGPQHEKLHQEAGQMAASDYVPNLSKYRLHPAGRPQMGSGLDWATQAGLTFPDQTRNQSGL